MSVLQSTISKVASYCRGVNTARFSVSPYLGRQSLEEKLGIQAKPKKPITPFLRYLRMIRSELIREKPDIKVTEIAKIGSERWKNIDAKTFSVLKQEYDSDVEKYQRDIKEYDLRLSPEIKEKLLMEKANMKMRKEKHDLKKKRASLGCPKRPPNTFLLFLKEHVSERGSSTYSEWVSNLGKKWKELSEEQKAPYLELQKKKLEEYKAKKAKWEKDMESKGFNKALKI
ncbi:hypothetical protein O3M35_008957 [Rhynocoris fuscipes]|uniref:HMG box domain-containing protein n=1 Tax=Rhynocoris fuscipes TaxID=488301 RepID=A0AAW1D6L5_9HEMI